MEQNLYKHYINPIKPFLTNYKFQEIIAYLSNALHQNFISQLFTLNAFADNGLYDLRFFVRC